MGVSERFQGANIIEAGRLSPYWGEHAARYRRALPMAAHKAVLDIACGTGYGIGLLKETARSVVGVDIDIDAARIAQCETDDRAAVLLGDGLRLPFRDESFDLVTSFETLEHLHERAAFLSELSRVLRPDGRLVMSTPNANYTQPVDGVPENPFHVHEYEPQELRDELDTIFEIESFAGQRLKAAAGMPPFLQAQRKLPRDAVTQTKLFGWKIFNKIPVATRERLSEAIWNKPFYPTEADYEFSEGAVADAPVLFAVCRKR